MKKIYLVLFLMVQVCGFKSFGALQCGDAFDGERAKLNFPFTDIAVGLVYGSGQATSVAISKDERTAKIRTPLVMGALTFIDKKEERDGITYRMYRGWVYFPNGTPSHKATLRLSETLLSNVSSGKIIFSDDSSQVVPDPVEVFRTNNLL